ncbi:MAG: 16S rRNA (guanine(966)-N(2))-methyltransferase RsmD [Candidatus Goldbacteria bacterium]|nr:16S rRNA (guanine(966)-N(2))-methyltransferase RsmD [Candidatus Goldiibacteriota bacterium]
MKISSGKFKGVNLLSPESKIRPTLIKVRQAIFNIIRPIINNSIFIDLFAGTGAIGFEALSNGASKVYFIEKKNYKILQKNAEKLRVEKNYYEIIPKDFRTALKILRRKNVFSDIIFADPPYNKGYIAQLLKNDIIKQIIIPQGIFIIEIFKKERENIELFLNDWIIDDERRYGDIFILFFKLKENIHV